jgi:glycosyltransferase involved in cell wall biosynthesis
MHKFLIDAEWKNVIIKHLRVDLSSRSDDFGKFSIRKLGSILKIILQVWAERIMGRIDILYYPPSGPVNKKTFYKDMSLLIFTRFLASKTIFHFHADKFFELQKLLNKFELLFAKLIYGHPGLCILILEPQVGDVQWLKPAKTVVIPNGIEDKFDIKRINRNDSEFNILYLGLLVPYKGIEYAVYTAKILRDRNIRFKWTFVGGWSSAEFRKLIIGLIEKFDLNDQMIFAGEKINDEKWEYFYTADVLCLPTYTDLMPLCILEGMMMSLPVVTTSLRTLPYIVDDKINGLLSPPKDPEKMANNIEFLYKNKKIAMEMGNAGRLKFEKCYSLGIHIDNMQKVIYQESGIL